MALSVADINQSIIDEILTGGGRTRAAGVRSVLNKITSSFSNYKDGGYLYEAPVGYTTVFDPGDLKAFMSKGAIITTIQTLIADIDIPVISNTAYNSTTWDDNFDGATKNVLRDKFVSVDTAISDINTALGDYYKRDGSLSLTGNMNAGGFSISSANNISASGLISALGGLSTDGTKSIEVDTVGAVIKIGFQSGLGNTGVRGTFIGLLAGNNNSANDIMAIGDYSCQNNTGAFIAAYGPYSGNANSANFCAFVGNSAGVSNTGIYSTFFGDGAGQSNTGGHCSFIGAAAGYQNTSARVKAIGTFAAQENNITDLFTVSEIKDIFWNNVGNKGFTTLQTVTMQAAMSEDGTNESAALSIFKLAHARGTGNADPGEIIFQRAIVQASGTTRHTLSDWWYFDAQGRFRSKGDIVVDDDASGAVLKDTTDGHYYRITITNGVIDTPTDLGTTL